MIEWLKFKGFENKDGIWFRKFTKTEEVVFHGTMTFTYEIQVKLVSDGKAAAVSYFKNGKCYKSKIHDAGHARTKNAIISTVEYAGYKL